MPSSHLTVPAPLCAVVFVAAAAPPAPAAAEYRIDDGTGSVNLGPNFAAEMLWGNVFTALPGKELITRISVAYGSIDAGSPVTLYLFDDPDNDGNPSDAVLLAQTSGLSDLPRTNSFIAYDIPPTPVSGSFFVAAKAAVNGSTIFPGRIDPQSAPLANRSWMFFDDTINIADLSSSPLFLNLSDNLVQGTFMIRATGVPIPAPAALPILFAPLLLRRRTRP